MSDPYTVLGVSRSATPEEIRRAVNKLRIKYHPDKNIGKENWAKEEFVKVQEAFEKLTKGDATGPQQRDCSASRSPSVRPQAQQYEYRRPRPSEQRTERRRQSSPRPRRRSSTSSQVSGLSQGCEEYWRSTSPSRYRRRGESPPPPSQYPYQSVRRLLQKVCPYLEGINGSITRLTAWLIDVAGVQRDNYRMRIVYGAREDSQRLRRRANRLWDRLLEINREPGRQPDSETTQESRRWSENQSQVRELRENILQITRTAKTADELLEDLANDFVRDYGRRGFDSRRDFGSRTRDILWSTMDHVRDLLGMVI